MVEQADIQEGCAIADIGRYVSICFAGEEKTGGMIVAEDEVDCIQFQGFFEDEADIYGGAGKAAFADDDEIQHFSRIIQIGDAKDFVAEILEGRLEPGGEIAALDDPEFVEVLAGLSSAAEFEGGGQGGGFSQADAFEAHQFFYGEFAEFLQIVLGLAEDLGAEFECGGSGAAAGAEDNGQ